MGAPKSKMLCLTYRLRKQWFDERKSGWKLFACQKQRPGPASISAEGSFGGLSAAPSSRHPRVQEQGKRTAE